ncbi:MAG: hypothetical protein ACRDI0_10470 [Actinomycetota bacterium]
MGVGRVRPSAGSKALLVTGVLLLAFLFLPWEIVVRSQPFLGIEGRTVYDSAFGSPLGVIVGIVAIAVVAWEAMLAAGMTLRPGNVSPATVGAVGGSLVSLLTVVLFLSTLGDTAWGAFLGVATGVAVAYSSYLRFREGGTARPSPPG